MNPLHARHRRAHRGTIAWVRCRSVLVRNWNRPASHVIWHSGPIRNCNLRRLMPENSTRFSGLVAIALFGIVGVGCRGSRVPPNSEPTAAATAMSVPRRDRTTDREPPIAASAAPVSPPHPDNPGAGDPPAVIDVPPLRAGKYRLTLRADSGPHNGAVSKEKLTLVVASATDRSPASGEVASDLGDPPLFYGWTQLDFQRVGAPMCHDELSPSPASQDPIRPGAFVPSRALWDSPVILIGTLTNLRTGSLYLDGCGIGLFIKTWTGTCFEGVWDQWGIATAGTGTFSACPL
jgi:hypothetical protein